MFNWPFFIAKRFITKEQQSKSKSVFFLAILSVSLSVAVIVIAFATVRGFRDEIKHKISMVHGDLVLDAVVNVENSEPIPLNDSLIPNLRKIQKFTGVDRDLFSSSKASIVKSDEEIEGIIAKGISKNQLKKYLGEFEIESVVSDNLHWVAISKTLAKRLNVGLNDNLRLVFFVQDSMGNTRPRARKLTVTALFETGVEKVDANMVLLDEAIVSRMMPENHSITQLEIWVKPGKNIPEIKKTIQNMIDIKSVRINSAEEFNRQIFDWLSILDLNVIILLCLITIVSITATCTTLLILMTERTAFVGLMQSMGARYADIQKIFIYQASIIAIAGILIGNFIAIGLCLLQNHFKWLTLNQEVYFIKYVAMKINVWEVLSVDFLSIALIYLSLYIPARYIKKIHPIIALKFK